jgi:GNAT superfamily N-acetyltransferase
MLFTYQTIPLSQLDDIQPLWEKHLHTEALVSCHFGDELNAVTFDKFKDYITKKPGPIQIDTACPVGNAQPIGCCISKFNESSRLGEVEFLCVLELFRNAGAGTELMRRAMNWMDEHDCLLKGMNIAYGNLEAMKFYEHLNFRAAGITMLWKTPPISNHGGTGTAASDDAQTPG